MTLRPKHNTVVTNSPSIASSSFQLSSSLSPVSSTSPTFQYVPSNASCTGSSPPPPGPVYTSKRRILPRRNEHGWFHLWLAAMKSSSSPHTRFANINSFDKSINEIVDFEYQAWIVQHPSALATFDHFIGLAHGKQVAVFLDYDGTLSPIVDDPDRAFMSEAMRDTLKVIAAHFPTAIISGRGRNKVYEFVKLPELYYAGSHGMDIMGPVKSCKDVQTCGTKVVNSKGNEIVLFQPPGEFILIIDEVCKILEEITKQVDGAKVENNKFCASVHFRCVRREEWSVLAKQVQNVLRSYPNLSLTHGRKVLEIRPSIAWDKGKALLFLLRTLGLEGQNNVFPIYIGDDKTDEDGFEVLNKGHGLSIIVSSVAKETQAVSSLRDPSEVMEFLRRLVAWGETHLNSSS